MGMDDDIKNGAQDLKGQGKEAVGDATGDDKLKVEGKVDQAGAHLKEGVADLKDRVTGDDDR
jgi:uncharacterized protein YjbJ (UPF0337 family)